MQFIAQGPSTLGRTGQSQTTVGLCLHEDVSLNNWDNVLTGLLEHLECMYDGVLGPHCGNKIKSQILRIKSDV